MRYAKGDDVIVRRTGEHGRVHRVRHPPTGGTLYGIRHRHPNMDEKATRRNYRDSVDCWVDADGLQARDSQITFE